MQVGNVNASESKSRLFFFFGHAWFSILEPEFYLMQMQNDLIISKFLHQGLDIVLYFKRTW